jgi:hypothetical protein
VKRVDDAVLRNGVHRGQSRLRHDLTAENTAMGLPLAWPRENVFPGPRSATREG